MSKDNEPFLDGIRIGGRREVVAQNTIELIHHIMAAGCGEMDEPEAKTAFMAGVSMVPLGALAMAFASDEYMDENHEKGQFSPTMDEICFGACYVMCALERCSGGVIAAFNLESIEKARVLFRQIYGRDYEHLCEPLQEAIAQWKEKNNNAKKDVPDSIMRFLPE